MASLIDLLYTLVMAKTRRKPLTSKLVKAAEMLNYQIKFRSSGLLTAMVAHICNILSLNVSTVLCIYLDVNISNCFMHFWFDAQVFLLFGGFVGLM